jgi:hypothetical protein
MFGFTKKKDKDYNLDNETLPSLSDMDKGNIGNNQGIATNNINNPFPNTNETVEDNLMPKSDYDMLNSNNNLNSNSSENFPNSFSNNINSNSTFEPKITDTNTTNTSIHNNSNIDLDLIKAKIDNIESKFNLYEARLSNMENKLDMIYKILVEEMSDETKKKLAINSAKDKI